jgi:Outer membrane lipoprotein carrier protein LolA
MTRPLPTFKIWLAITMSFFCARSFSATQMEIDKTVSHLNRVNFIKGQFTQLKKLQGLTYSLKAQGHFIFWKNQGLYLATEKPFFNAFTITSAAMINWQETGEASIAQEQTGIIQHEINKTLLAFFSADIKAIEQKFSADWIFNNENWQLTLTPKLEIIQKNMRQAVIQGNRYMESLKLIAGNGDITTITFSAHEESKAPSAEECRRFYLSPQAACKMYQ